MKYTLELERVEKPVDDPVSAVVDALVQGGGLARRWSFASVAGRLSC